MSDMNQYFYMRNRNCSCSRCRTRGLLGPAVLITLGVLFTLQEYMYIRFDRTWPVLLLVIGIFLLISRTASLEGHVPPFGTGGQAVPPPGAQDPWAGGRVPPSPGAPPAPESSGQQQNDEQVKQ